MKKQLIWLALGSIVLTIVVLAGAASLLNSVNSPLEGTDAGGEEASISTMPEAAPIVARPDCPSTGAGGVALDCLGGEPSQSAGEKPTVVNLWAWWCGPCRDELPYFDEFAATHPEYEVVGVHADANAGNGAALLEDLDVSLPSYQDDDNLFAGTLGLPGVIPITVVFDGEEQVGMFAQPFDSVAEIEQAVAGVLEEP